MSSFNCHKISRAVVHSVSRSVV